MRIFHYIDCVVQHFSGHTLFRGNMSDDIILFAGFLTFSAFSALSVSKKVVQCEISFPTVCHMPMFREKLKNP